MSNIRVTYSGLIAFLVGIIGVITGIIFTIIVTRRLSPEELGLWTLIGSLIAYVVIVEPIISYWTTRQIARGEKVGRTSFATSGLFSIGGFAAFYLIAIVVSDSLSVNIFPIILASALVPITFLNNTLSAITLSHYPQGVSYSVVSFESSKLPIGFGLVYFLELGLIGAIIATIISSFIKTTVLIFFTRKELVGEIKKHVIKFWLRLSWIPLYTNGAGFIFTLDVLVYSLFTNSLIGLAYWGVTSAISNVVGHSGLISQAIYPKLLATGKKEFAEKNLERLMYFAIPFLAASILFAKPGLHILNPIYIDGVVIVYFLTFRTFANIMLNNFYNILGAYENVDLDKSASLKQYVKSRLFFLPTLNYIMNGVYIILLILFLYFSENLGLTEVDLVAGWSIILLFVTIPFLLYGIIKVRQEYQISFHFKSTSKYIVSSLISFIVVFFVLDNSLIYSESIFEFLPQVIPLIFLGGFIYFGLTYLIDKSTRELFSSIVNEIRK